MMSHRIAPVRRQPICHLQSDVTAGGRTTRIRIGQLSTRAHWERLFVCGTGAELPFAERARESSAWRLRAIARADTALPNIRRLA
jgi:hypothetical protein